LLYQVAEEWAALFNRLDQGLIPDVIADATGEEYVDERTNLYLMGRPQEPALVLSTSPDDYLLVRWDGDSWSVDDGPVDWEALEDAIFSDVLEDDEPF
jgi:hypothetical protein